MANGSHEGRTETPFALNGNRRTGRRLLCLVLAASLLLSFVQPGGTAIRFKRSGEATLGGADALAALPDACEVGRNHLWVEVDGRGECIAFYATQDPRRAKQAILFFEGDIPPGYNRDGRKLKQHLASLRRSLEMLSAAFHVPYVLVARPGTFGSTGNHGERRRDREYLVARAAVDAMRERFDLPVISLAGQSGGATIVGALLALGISGVKCAVPASGGYDLTAMLDWHAKRQGVIGAHRENPATLFGSFNVMDHLDGVRADPGRRVYVLGDPRDQVTPFPQQRRFVERLKAAGHQAELVEGEARGPDRHGLAFTALKLAGLCATGASDAEIRRAAKAR
ncbi:MAG: alpha/beta hydrolase family protein [Hyphomicrobiaceae bacterium]